MVWHFYIATEKIWNKRRNERKNIWKIGAHKIRINLAEQHAAVYADEAKGNREIFFSWSILFLSENYYYFVVYYCRVDVILYDLDEANGEWRRQQADRRWMQWENAKIGSEYAAYWASSGKSTVLSKNDGNAGGWQEEREMLRRKIVQIRRWQQIPISNTPDTHTHTPTLICVCVCRGEDCLLTM